MSAPLGRRQTVNVGDVNALGAEDRIAVMQMVAEGEIDLDEAIAKVKAQAAVKQGKAKSDQRINRRGGMKKFRGRLDLELRIQKATAFSLIILDVKKGRELMPMLKGISNPYVRAEIRMMQFQGQGKQKSQFKVHTSPVHKDTNNPIFNEQFTWELRSQGAGDEAEFNRRLAQMYVCLTVESKSGSMIKRLSSQKSVIGTMAFSVFDMWESGDMNMGWYKLLDEVKGQYQNLPYRHNRPIVAPVLAGAGTQSRNATPTPSPKTSRPPSPAMKEQFDPDPFAVEDSNPFAEAAATLTIPGVGRVPPPLPNSVPPPLPNSVPPPIRAVAAPAPAPIPAPASAPVKSVKKSQLAPAAPAERVSADTFNYLKVLGQGSFGKVVMAEHKKNGEVYAVKIIKKESVLEDDDVESTMTERRVLALGTGSAFLTRLYATFQSGNKLFYVMEMITGGDLMFHIQNDKVFTLERARFYAAEISLGLWYLHDNGVLYRDLKLDNVMLDNDGHVKIADFGMCKEQMFGQARTTTFCGTPGYLAPEIIKEKPYGVSVDWWSLGVLMYEMTVGDSPFDAEDDEELFHLIQTHKPPFDKGFDPAAKSAVQGFMTRDEEKRLGCGKYGKEDIQSHPFFKSIDWGKLERRELKPPFTPNQGDKKDAANFDEEFTNEDPRVSPGNPRAVAGIDQMQFKGFSFVNPGFDSADGGADTGASAAAVGLERQNTLAGKAWYRPDLTRSQVTAALRNTAAGSFLIRESTTQPGCYALAMHAGGGQPWNGLITPSVDKSGRTQYQMFAGRKFSDLITLIDHYSITPVTKNAAGAAITLKTS